MPTIARLTLTDFRSYASAIITVGPRAIVITGDNGQGKTNLLDAVSLLSPGRGLRGVALSDAARSDGPGGWTVAAEVDVPGGAVQIGTGTTADAPDRRIVRINGAAAPIARLGEWLSVLWLTPAMDRLFVDTAGARRRFLDRLVLALEPGHGGEVTRYLMMSAHYRTISDFGDEAVESALTNLHRLYEAKARAEVISNQKAAVVDQRAESVWAEFLADCQKAREEMTKEMANDFNTPGTIGAVFTLIRAYNRALAEPRAAATPAAILGAQELIRVIEDELGGFVGLGRRPSNAMLTQIGEIRARTHSAKEGASAPLGKAEIENLIGARADAKKGKNFSEADRIRKELTDRGVAIKDSPTGTTWEYTN